MHHRIHTGLIGLEERTLQTLQLLDASEDPLQFSSLDFSTSSIDLDLVGFLFQLLKRASLAGKVACQEASFAFQAFACWDSTS